jgi:tetratricopeptide (TPR) repeat protein
MNGPHQAAVGFGHSTIQQAAGDITNVHFTLTTAGPATAPVGSVAVVTPIPATISAEIFVGREQQTRFLLAILEATDPSRPGAVGGCVVEGMAGSGKTTLAWNVAVQAVAAGWFTGGAVFIDLHSYDPDHGQIFPDQAFGPLLRALGRASELVPTTPGEQAADYHRQLDQFAQVDRRVLVVLDNASSTAQIRDLIPRQPTHRVVITTRDTLRPPGVIPLDLGALDEPEAVRLLRHTLAARWADDPRLAGEADPVAEARLVRTCGCLPLAVTIAAAVLADDRDLRLTDLADDLDDTTATLRVLQHGERAVQAALETSWRRVSTRTPDAARLLRLLVVNPGPDIGDAAVVALAGSTPAVTRAELRALREAHLIERFDQRWRLHDLVRAFVRQVNIDEFDLAELLLPANQLADYYLTSADAADKHLTAFGDQPVPDRFADRQQALAWLDAERGNLVAATSWGLNNGAHLWAVQLAHRLAGFLSWRRHFTDGVTVARLGVIGAAELDDPQFMAVALGNLGNALLETRHIDEAISVLQKCAHTFHDSGDQHSRATALTNLGNALQLARQFSEAIAVYNNAIRIFRDINDRHREAIALTNLSYSLGNLHRVDEAIDAGEQAVQIFRDTNDPNREGQALINLANALRAAGRFDEAVTASQDAARIHRGTGNHHAEGLGLINLALALQRADRIQEAISTSRRAVQIFRDTRDMHNESRALSVLGDALCRAGQMHEALSTHEEAVRVQHEAADQLGKAEALIILGDALYDAGRYTDLIAVCEKAAQIFRDINNRRGEGLALAAIGTAFEAMDRVPEGRALRQQAAEMLRESGDLAMAERALTWMPPASTS